MRKVLKILAVALINSCTARLWQLFAIPSGNVTAVWLSSGIMLADLAFVGRDLWPGEPLMNTYAE